MFGELSECFISLQQVSTEEKDTGMLFMCTPKPHYLGLFSELVSVNHCYTDCVYCPVVQHQAGLRFSFLHLFPWNKIHVHTSTTDALTVLL